jgi:hypothetical protein
MVTLPGFEASEINLLPLEIDLVVIPVVGSEVRSRRKPNGREIASTRLSPRIRLADADNRTTPPQARLKRKPI